MGGGKVTDRTVDASGDQSGAMGAEVVKAERRMEGGMGGRMERNAEYVRSTVQICTSTSFVGA